MKHFIQEFKSKRILVLGDIILDKYIWGNVNRISPEAPVPVVEVIDESQCLGGAGNVSNNVESLGAKALLVGAVGNDDSGIWIKKNVSDNRGIFNEDRRPTTVKTRIVAHQQQVVRVDMERKIHISFRTKEEILEVLEAEDYDGIIISDYGKGVLSNELVKGTLSFAQKRNMPVFVDPKNGDVSLYSPVTLITPNHVEAERITGLPCFTDDQVAKCCLDIMEITSASYIILKRGENGMNVMKRGEEPIHIPSKSMEVYDVTGAGDTVIAIASLALLSGASIQEAASLANMAAGIVVGKIGTATVEAAEILEFLEKENKNK